MTLPDFLLLPEADVARELKRQENLRRDFNSRARLSPAEIETARALVLEQNLRETLRTQEGREIRRQTKNQLADVVAAQGRFIEAAELTTDRDALEFFQKAALAIFYPEEGECDCGERVETVGQNRIKLPKYRVIKQVYNLKLGQFGYLVECNACGEWIYLGSDPTPTQISPNDFDAENPPPNDLERLKV